MLQLYITTKEPDPAPFTVQTLRGFSFTGVAMHNTTTVVSFDNSYEAQTGQGDYGIHISAGDKTIVVYGWNYDPLTVDAFLALPCARLAVDQYEYYGISYRNYFDTQLLFVACEDNTIINFDSTTVTLNRMETFLNFTFSDNTGTRIVSNKPISVFPGASCTSVPVDMGGRDHLTEQFPPTAVWGTRFLSASFPGIPSGALYRILTSKPSTNVTVNCTTYSQPQTYSLATAGAWQEFSTSDDSFCVIESNNPLLVVEFIMGRTWPLLDPSQIMVPPIAQYSNAYVFNARSEFSANYITMFVSPEHFQPEKIFVDDVSQEGANWITIYCADGTVCGYTASASLDIGDHRVYYNDTSAKIGLVAYGNSQTDTNSYAYPVGLRPTPSERMRFMLIW